MGEGGRGHFRELTISSKCMKSRLKFPMILNWPAEHLREETGRGVTFIEREGNCPLYARRKCPLINLLEIHINRNLLTYPAQQ